VDPQILRGGFRIAVLILGAAILILPFEPAGSAEHVVTVMAAVVGGAFVIGIALLTRFGNAPLPHDSAERKDYNGRSTTGGR
jgi:hypothetical protein